MVYYKLHNGPKSELARQILFLRKHTKALHVLVQGEERGL